MSKRKRLTGKAEEMRQIAQVLRQNGLPDKAVKVALLAMCGVEVHCTASYGVEAAASSSQMLGACG